MLGAALFAEKVLLNGFVDFDRAQAARGLGAILRVAQHWGFRFLVAFAAAGALFAYVRGWQTVRAVAAQVRAAPMHLGWILTHLLLVAILAPLSYLLYRYTVTELSFAGVVVLWGVVGIAAVLAGL